MADASDNDVLDEGLIRLSSTGPEFRGGLSNHGPMAAEALIRLGRPGEVERWLDGYLPRLDPAPHPSDRIADDTWQDALGKYNRVADWTVYLRDQLKEDPWRDVLARWWPRLLPGVAAGATHGIIRTAHAARSLAAAENAGAGATSPRLGELASGLAYWAAAYFEIPGAEQPGAEPPGAEPPGDAQPDGRPPSETPDLPAAIRGLPVVPVAVPGNMITTRLKAGLAREPGFGQAVRAFTAPASPDAARTALRGLAREFAGNFLVYGRKQPITWLHAVTAPVAAYSALPLLPAELARPTCDALWLVTAAIYTVHAGIASAEPLPKAPAPTPDDLTDRAVATGDEHAIKLTEACLRLHAQTPDPVLLHAAARASTLLGR